MNRSNDSNEDERDNFSNDDDDDNDNGGDNSEMGNQDSNNQKTTEIEKWVNVNDLELKRLFSIEVNVVIESQPLPVINHSSNVFDIEVTVNKILVVKNLNNKYID